MKIEVEFWQLVGLLLGFLWFVFTAGKILLSQIELCLNERFGALEQGRSHSEKGWQRKTGTAKRCAKPNGCRDRYQPNMIPARR